MILWQVYSERIGDVALGYPVRATFNIMSLIAVFGIAYRLGEHYKVDALASGALSLVTFLLATPFQVVYMIPDTKGKCDL